MDYIIQAAEHIQQYDEPIELLVKPEGIWIKIHKLCHVVSWITITSARSNILILEIDRFVKAIRAGEGKGNV